MQYDPDRVSEVNSWLRKAHDDLRAAEISMSAIPPILGVALFHCQQTVEKAIKAFLAWNDKVFGKTHNLVELGALAVDVDPELEPLLRRAAALTEYAWRYRYPGDIEDPTPNEARDAFAIAGEVLINLQNRLPKIVRP